MMVWLRIMCCHRTRFSGWSLAV